MSLGTKLFNHYKRLIFLRQTRFVSCWSCGKDANKLVSNLFCPNCKMLQSPNRDINYFNIMGVQETYDLDENDLAKKFKELQKFLHPDKFANRSVLHFINEIILLYHQLLKDYQRDLKSLSVVCMLRIT